MTFGWLLNVNSQTVNHASDAKIEGLIVNKKTNKPIINELVIFKSVTTKKQYKTTSDEKGKYATRVPTGDQYEILIDGFKDSISHNLIDIPSPEPGSYYTDAFKVNLEYEPAKIFILENVEFDFGKSTLRPESYGTLNELAAYLKRKPNERIEIGGHTDNIGSEADNLLLGKERANTIVKYLISNGISNSRLNAQGYGAQQPLDTNDTEAGRQKNRRSEVKILEREL